MNILIVDDDAALLRSLEIVLSSHGHRVTAFCNPIAASQYMAKGPDVDVLLIDYAMREMNGCEWLRLMGEQMTAQCNTIMITGHREEIQSTDQLRTLGIRHVLCKPLDLDQLCELVEQNRRGGEDSILNNTTGEKNATYP